MNLHKEYCPIFRATVGQHQSTAKPYCNCDAFTQSDGSSPSIQPKQPEKQIELRKVFRCQIDIVQEVRDKYKGHSFALIKTNKIKPFGYIGYMLTVYDKKDDVSPILDIKERTIQSIARKLRDS